MFRRSFESQDIRTLAVRFRVCLIYALMLCALFTLGSLNSLTEEQFHSLLSCSLCYCGVFCLFYNMRGMILNKTSSIFRQIFPFIPFLFFFLFFNVTFSSSHVDLLS